MSFMTTLVSTAELITFYGGEGADNVRLRLCRSQDLCGRVHKALKSKRCSALICKGISRDGSRPRNSLLVSRPVV
ncbi:hypothetical protein CO2235_150029 [Cupriavidus oxalaticus]|uniref:Uncharacterized protein n=1 Tax=Cupriavidus oxalaticus TaxID=96344 RepID=A0A375FZ49_9BURK|nr:hypothetical protein CO2235_U600088 [Cupriavidus oxalaticus]SPC12374.1 hypothetical protein CO2235_150029 [Cupriavidus oxalaticus]